MKKALTLYSLSILGLLAFFNDDGLTGAVYLSAAAIVSMMPEGKP